MRLFDFVPVIDIEQPVPDEPEAIVECLMEEGWPIEAVMQWSEIYAILTPLMLKTRLSARKN